MVVDEYTGICAAVEPLAALFFGGFVGASVDVLPLFFDGPDASTPLSATTTMPPHPASSNDNAGAAAVATAAAGVCASITTELVAFLRTAPGCVHPATVTLHLWRVEARAGMRRDGIQLASTGLSRLRGVHGSHSGRGGSGEVLLPPFTPANTQFSGSDTNSGGGIAAFLHWLGVGVAADAGRVVQSASPFAGRRLLLPLQQDAEQLSSGNGVFAHSGLLTRTAAGAAESPSALLRSFASMRRRRVGEASSSSLGHSLGELRQAHAHANMHSQLGGGGGAGVRDESRVPRGGATGVGGSSLVTLLSGATPSAPWREDSSVSQQPLSTTEQTLQQIRYHQALQRQQQQQGDRLSVSPYPFPSRTPTTNVKTVAYGFATRQSTSVPSPTASSAATRAALIFQGAGWAGEVGAAEGTYVDTHPVSVSRSTVRLGLASRSLLRAVLVSLAVTEPSPSSTSPSTQPHQGGVGSSDDAHHYYHRGVQLPADLDTTSESVGHTSCVARRLLTSAATSASPDDATFSCVVEYPAAATTSSSNSSSSSAAHPHVQSQHAHSHTPATISSGAHVATVLADGGAASCHSVLTRRLVGGSPATLSAILHDAASLHDCLIEALQGSVAALAADYESAVTHLQEATAWANGPDTTTADIGAGSLSSAAVAAAPAPPTATGTATVIGDGSVRVGGDLLRHHIASAHSSFLSVASGVSTVQALLSSIELPLQLQQGGRPNSSSGGSAGWLTTGGSGVSSSERVAPILRALLQLARGQQLHHASPADTAAALLAELGRRASIAEELPGETTAGSTSGIGGETIGTGSFQLAPVALPHAVDAEAVTRVSPVPVPAADSSSSTATSFSTSTASDVWARQALTLLPIAGTVARQSAECAAQLRALAVSSVLPTLARLLREEWGQAQSSHAVDGPPAPLSFRVANATSNSSSASSRTPMLDVVYAEVRCCVEGSLEGEAESVRSSVPHVPAVAPAADAAVTAVTVPIGLQPSPPSPTTSLGQVSWLAAALLEAVCACVEAAAGAVPSSSARRSGGDFDTGSEGGAITSSATMRSAPVWPLLQQQHLHSRQRHQNPLPASTTVPASSSSPASAQPLPHSHAGGDWVSLLLRLQHDDSTPLALLPTVFLLLRRLLPALRPLSIEAVVLPTSGEYPRAAADDGSRTDCDAVAHDNSAALATTSTAAQLAAYLLTRLECATGAANALLPQQHHDHQQRPAHQAASDSSKPSHVTVSLGRSHLIASECVALLRCLLRSRAWRALVCVELEGALADGLDVPLVKLGGEGGSAGDRDVRVIPAPVAQGVAEAGTATVPLTADSTDSAPASFTTDSAPAVATASISAALFAAALDVAAAEDVLDAVGVCVGGDTSHRHESRVGWVACRRLGVSIPSNSDDGSAPPVGAASSSTADAAVTTSPPPPHPHTSLHKLSRALAALAVLGGFIEPLRPGATVEIVPSRLPAAYAALSATLAAAPHASSTTAGATATAPHVSSSGYAVPPSSADTGPAVGPGGTSGSVGASPISPLQSRLLASSPPIMPAALRALQRAASEAARTLTHSVSSSSLTPVYGRLSVGGDGGGFHSSLLLPAVEFPVCPAVLMHFAAVAAGVAGFSGAVSVSSSKLHTLAALAPDVDWVDDDEDDGDEGGNGTPVLGSPGAVVSGGESAGSMLPAATSALPAHTGAPVSSAAFHTATALAVAITHTYGENRRSATAPSTNASAAFTPTAPTSSAISSITRLLIPADALRAVSAVPFHPGSVASSTWAAVSEAALAFGLAPHLRVPPGAAAAASASRGVSSSGGSTGSGGVVSSPTALGWAPELGNAHFTYGGGLWGRVVRSNGSSGRAVVSAPLNSRGRWRVEFKLVKVREGDWICAPFHSSPCVNSMRVCRRQSAAVCMCVCLSCAPFLSTVPYGHASTPDSRIVLPLLQDDAGSETTCFGLLNPPYSDSYKAPTSWMYRAYNGWFIQYLACKRAHSALLCLRVCYTFFIANHFLTT